MELHVVAAPTGWRDLVSARRSRPGDARRADEVSAWRRNPDGLRWSGSAPPRNCSANPADDRRKGEDDRRDRPRRPRVSALLRRAPLSPAGPLTVVCWGLADPCVG